MSNKFSDVWRSAPASWSAAAIPPSGSDAAFEGRMNNQLLLGFIQSRPVSSLCILHFAKAVSWPPHSTTASAMFGGSSIAQIRSVKIRAIRV